MKTIIAIAAIALSGSLHAQNVTAAFSGRDSACAFMCNTFTDQSTSTSGSIVAWEWSFPGGSPSMSTVQNPTTCYSAPGAYDVTLIVTDSNGNKDTAVSIGCVQVFPIPKAGFSASTYQTYLGTNITFSNSSVNGSTYLWIFGDGDSSLQENPTHTYTACATGACSYQVCMSVSSPAGCWDTLCKTINIIASINEPLSGNHIHIRSNPWSDEITVAFDFIAKDLRIILYDALGQKVRSKENINGKSATLERNNLPAACYFACFSQENTVIATKKLLVIAK